MIFSPAWLLGIDFSAILAFSLGLVWMIFHPLLASSESRSSVVMCCKTVSEYSEWAVCPAVWPGLGGTLSACQPPIHHPSHHVTQPPGLVTGCTLQKKCLQVCAEGRGLQPDGRDELPDGEAGVQDAGQPAAEEPAQHPQQGRQVGALRGPA